MSIYRTFYMELKRRNVHRVATAYVVVAWLLIQVAETIFPLFGFGDTPARITVVLLAIGMFPVLLIAWAFELTPEGLKKERDVDRSIPASRGLDKQWDRMILVALTVALAYFAVDKFVLSPQREKAIEEKQIQALEQARQQGRSDSLIESYGDKSIAVLPFLDMSPDGDQAYFSDGISEELLNQLTEIPNLRVISRTSSFALKGTALGTRDIAEKLNVAYILEGSVRRNGGMVRITAQLIDAFADAHVWSETYDRSFEDIFAIQDQISGAIADKLKISLTHPVTPKIRTSPQVYDLYLAAFIDRFNPDNIEDSITRLKKAIDLDPDYSPAWALLGARYLTKRVLGIGDWEEMMGLSEHATNRALQLDPENSTALATLAGLDMQGNRIQAAADALQTALSFNPTDTQVISSSTRLLRLLRRNDEAIVIGRFLMANDPLHTGNMLNLWTSYLFAGNDAEAENIIRQAVFLDPQMANGRLSLAATLTLLGRYDEALKEFELVEGGIHEDICQLYISQQTEPEAVFQEKFNDMKAFLTDRDHPAAFSMSSVYALLGYADEAFVWLNTWIDQDQPFAIYAEQVQFPYFRGIRDDPRWDQAMKRLGISDAELAAIDFEVVLPLTDVEVRQVD